MSLSMRTYFMDPVYGAIQKYHEAKKVTITLDLPVESFPLEVALVSSQVTNSICEGELYACTIDGYIFITSAVPSSWARFAVFHALAEQNAPSDKDNTGTAKHFQALAFELGFAKKVLKDSKYQQYIRWRKKVERSNFFRLEYESIVEEICARFHLASKELLSPMKGKQ